MWKPIETGWGRRSWIVVRDTPSSRGGTYRETDGFAHKLNGWRNRKFGSRNAAQKRADELNKRLTP
jgi:hypothetical protein